MATAKGPDATWIAMMAALDENAKLVGHVAIAWNRLLDNLGKLCAAGHVVADRLAQWLIRGSGIGERDIHIELAVRQPAQHQSALSQHLSCDVPQRVKDRFGFPGVNVGPDLP